MTKNKIKKANLTQLKAICQLNEKKLVKRLPKYLQNLGYDNIIGNKQFVYAKGELPVMLVAHLDTVHKDLPTEIYYDEKQTTMWSPQGIGADDRAGVYAILHILGDGFRPHVLFTTGEEIGGVGASACTKQIPKIDEDIKYLIELDRRGSDDCVFYDLECPEFEEYIETYGFKSAWGSFSDISFLCPDWGVAGVNLSIGYYGAHTLQETLNVTQMMETVSKVENMLRNIYDVGRFHYVERVYAYSTKYYDSTYAKGYAKDMGKKYVSNANGTISFLNDDDYYDYVEQKDRHSGTTSRTLPIGTTVTCCICDDEVAQGWIEHDGNYYCKHCFDMLFFYCDNCNEICDRIIESPCDEICYDCYNDFMEHALKHSESVASKDGEEEEELPF